MTDLDSLLLLLFSCSVASESLQPHGLQDVRFPCPSPSPRVYSNLCPSSRWCHPTIPSSVIFFSCLQPFPASGSFLMSLLFAAGGQSIETSTSASVLPVNIQGWFHLGLSKGPSRAFSSTTVRRHQFFSAQHIKEQRHHFVDKDAYSQSMVFPVVMYECESWTIRKAECLRMDGFELWCCRRLLRGPWTARRSNQSILKETNSEYSLEGLMLKLKL